MKVRRIIFLYDFYAQSKVVKNPFDFYQQNLWNKVIVRYCVSKIKSLRKNWKEQSTNSCATIQILFCL